MRLRIIAGEYKGRYITASQDNESFRPTLERVRQSIAEIIKGRVDEAVCADVFAGSGAFGFELLSRGASSVDFVEKDRRRAQQITQNSISLDCKDQCNVYSVDIRVFIKTAAKSYDIIYCDPPYDLPGQETWLIQLINLLSPGGLLIYERRRENEIRYAPQLQTLLVDKRDFGGTVAEFFQNSAPEHPDE